MAGTVAIIGGNDRKLEDLVREAGLRPTVVSVDQLSSSQRAPEAPDAVLVDIRQDRQLMSVIAVVKRRYPTVGVAVVVSSLDPAIMLEAMRAGVTEAVSEPVALSGLQSALAHIMSRTGKPTEGRVYAIVGAKGGIGATTIAVNLAEAFAQATGNALLMDLQMAAGDATVLAGIEPRFTLADALENTHRLDEAFFRGLISHTRSGLDILAASSRAATVGADPHRIRLLLDFAIQHYHAVLLDVPRGDLSMLDSLDSATAIYVVVNHELPTIRSAQRLIAKLKQPYGERVSVLVNRSDREAEIALADIRKAVGVPVSHVFPSDYRQALAAANKGQLLAETSQGRLAASFHEFVAALTRGRTKDKDKDAPAEESGGLFGWLSARRVS